MSAALEVEESDSVRNIPISRFTEKHRGSFWRLWQQVILLSPHDLIAPVDLRALWRRHLVWAKNDERELLDIVTARFATTNIFLSLMCSAEVATYFSPSDIVTDVRQALRSGPENVDYLEYLAGIVLIISIIVTGSAILANYTAWGIFKALGKSNTPIVLRSSVGLYAAQLPSRLAFLSICLFFAFLGK